MATISACMIVKDAEEHLERCLHSLQGVVDEVIIVDTGSSDKTLEIAERFQARIHHFTWADDFSAARNESLQHATKDWILIIDDDEAFDKREIEQLKSKLDTLEADAIIIPKKNFTNERNMQGWVASSAIEGFDGYFISKRVQMFKNNKGVTFSYKLHETVMPSLQEKKCKVVEVTDVFLLHYGYSTSREGYAQLVEKELKEHGNDIKVLYDAGVTFLNTGDYDKSIDAFTKVRKIHPNYLKTLANLGAALTKKGDYYVAAQVYLDAIDRNPKDTSSYNNLAVIFRRAKNYDRAEFLLKKGLRIQKDPRLFYLLARVYEDQGNIDDMEKAVQNGLAYFSTDVQLLQLQKKFN